MAASAAGRCVQKVRAIAAAFQRLPLRTVVRLGFSFMISKMASLPGI